MRLSLEAAKEVYRAGEDVTVRLIAHNETYEAVAIDRRLLVGPNFAPDQATGLPVPVSVEAGFEEEAANDVVLNPGCFYGRERGHSTMPPGRLVVYGYLLSEPTDALLPHSPAEEGVLAEAAEPLLLTIEP